MIQELQLSPPPVCHRPKQSLPSLRETWIWRGAAERRLPANLFRRETLSSPFSSFASPATDYASRAIRLWEPRVSLGVSSADMLRHMLHFNSLA